MAEEESYYSDLDYDGEWDSDESSDLDNSEHTLSVTIKTHIQMDEGGLGIILIQNGPYLQISGLVEKGAAARDNKLQAGDILLKIGHANVLGWTLRELRQLLHSVPTGTVLQIQVYRDFIKIPSRWQTALMNIPELKGPATDIESHESEENWISSEVSENESEEMVEDNESGSEESYEKPEYVRALSVVSAHSLHRVHSACSIPSIPNVKTTCSLSIEPLIKNQPQWISKDWHIFEKKTYTFTVGSDIACDIMIHKDFEAESKVDTSTLYLMSSSPYWTMPKHKAPPSESSSSSMSDAFWLENVSYELE
ncbi:PDZ domain-containing protein 9 [Erythrolamprus reginae]|uniref:PDZ domain-containing protein 9 n=1 Tax=Erythrolamprus reginae TaxID=121349 RepID=UPI00396C3331